MQPQNHGGFMNYSTKQRTATSRSFLIAVALIHILTQTPLETLQATQAKLKIQIREKVQDKPFTRWEWFRLTLWPPYCGWNNLGVEHKKKHEYQKAFQCYSAGAQQPDHPLPLINLAKCYMDGRGTERNPAKAFECYQKAGDWPDALEGMAYCYETGIGTNKDLTKAIEYYKKALASLDESFRIDPMWKTNWPNHVVLYEKVSQRLTECTRDVDKQTKASTDED